MKNLCYGVLQLSFGEVGLLWVPEEGTVVRVLLPREGERMKITVRGIYPAAVECPFRGEVIEEVKRRLFDYDEGGDVSFVDLVNLPAGFLGRILAEVLKIPRGKVNSYGNLAAGLGLRGQARAVGQALAANPYPILVPCHRVVRSDGSLGGFAAGERMVWLKKHLLIREGIVVNESGYVEKRYLVKES